MSREMIEVDEWREDVLDERGRVLHADVLFARVTIPAVAFHAPVFKESPEVVEAAKEILFAKARAFLLDRLPERLPPTEQARGPA